MDEARRSIRFHPQPAAEAARLLTEAIAAQAGESRLAVAGGSAAAVLGTVRRSLGAERWGRVRLTWVDERCVPFSHPDSNRGTAYRDGHLDPSDPPGLELSLYLDHESPAAACARVELALRENFQSGLDLLLLGMGEDGHIASLFPGRVLTDAMVFAVKDSPKPPALRITLGLPFLAQASMAVMLALGRGKQAPLCRLASGDPALPATALRHLSVITDLQAFASE
jgi:6-phosphogluconolactonase